MKPYEPDLSIQITTARYGHMITKPRVPLVLIEPLDFAPTPARAYRYRWWATPAAWLAIKLTNLVYRARYEVSEGSK